MKRALQRVVTGTPIREAAEAEGYASHADVHRYAKRFGLLEIGTEQLMARQRRVVALGLEELERRLSEDPASVSTRDLVVSNGVGMDKIARRERWDRPGDGAGSFLSRLGELAARVKAGESVGVSLLVEKA